MATAETNNGERVKLTSPAPISQALSEIADKYRIFDDFPEHREKFLRGEITEDQVARKAARVRRLAALRREASQGQHRAPVQAVYRRTRPPAPNV